MQTTESALTTLCKTAFRSAISVYALPCDGFDRKIKPSSQGHKYALTVIDTLMNYTWYTPQYTKSGSHLLSLYPFQVSWATSNFGRK